VLFVEETHACVGSRVDEIEALYRDGWMPELGRTDDARLLWFCHLAHGSSLSYRIVTITAVRDGAAWERLASSVGEGALRDWARQVDECRHEVRSRIWVELDCSPLRPDLSLIPTTPTDATPALYMQDTMWPRRGRTDEYVAALGSVYLPMLDRPEAQLSVEGAFRTVPGGGSSPQVVLMQRVRDLDRLTRLLAEEPPPGMDAPGSWMHEALTYRERWRSRLLRTASWSPVS
jgi:hypothetical protein